MKTEKNPIEKIIKKLDATGEINDEFFVEIPHGTLHVYTADKMFKEGIKLSNENQQEAEEYYREIYIDIIEPDGKRGTLSFTYYGYINTMKKDKNNNYIWEECLQTISHPGVFCYNGPDECVEHLLRKESDEEKEWRKKRNIIKRFL